MMVYLVAFAAVLLASPVALAVCSARHIRAHALQEVGQ